MDGVSISVLIGELCPLEIPRSSGDGEVTVSTMFSFALLLTAGLIPANEWRFVWMTEPPLFEWSEDEAKWVSVHHPFTAPADPEDLDPSTATARAYDLVLNGYELGGGSIRIHRPELQREVFAALGLSAEEQEEKFGMIKIFC